LRGVSVPRPTPPPVFAITIVPFAAAVGYVTIAAPYWLAVRGASVAAIGTMSGLAMSPHAFKALWAPVLDVGARRRAWYLAMSALTAVLVAALALLPAPEERIGVFTALAFLVNVAGTTACAAADGLMAITTAPERKGAAAAWRMAGNVGGTGVLGAGILWVAARTSVPAAGLALAFVVLLSGTAAIPIHEPRELATRRGGSAAREALSKLGVILRDVWEMVKSREGWTALVICAVPVGGGALTNLFSALAPS
jgi:PAT family beta-lactamase induction signal transducer AmpG